MELPRYDSDGAPAGVKEAWEDGGGPAGVVDGLSPRKAKDVDGPESLPGVDGAGLESGTTNR